MIHRAISTLDLSLNMHLLHDYRDLTAVELAETYSLDAVDWIACGNHRASSKLSEPQAVGRALPRDIIYSGT